jgi:hypothetical protein
MKVALVGTEVTSRGHTPWDDPSWEIWACSGASVDYPRVDHHFELHNVDWALQLNGQAELDYILRLAEHPSVWVSRPHVLLPQAKLFPRNELVAAFGPYFFTSTIAWMMAKAIYERVEELGLFGISMTASSEYAYQRPGCQYFLQICKERGILVHAPLESDILQPPPQYGFREYESFYRKMYSAKKHATERLNENLRQQHELVCGEQGLRGALSRIEYDMHTFSMREQDAAPQLHVVDKIKGAV